MFAFLLAFAVTLILASHGITKLLEGSYLFCAAYAGAALLGALISSNLLIVWRDEIRTRIQLEQDNEDMECRIQTGQNKD